MAKAGHALSAVTGVTVAAPGPSPASLAGSSAAAGQRQSRRAPPSTVSTVPVTKRLSIRYEVGGGDVARLADRFGDGPLGQRAEQRRTLRFRGRVPHRGVNRSRADRVDPDRSELNGQPPGQSLDRCGSAGHEGGAGGRPDRDCPGRQHDRAARPDPGGGVPDRGDRTPEADVEQPAGLVQRHLVQRPRGDAVSSGVHR